MSFGRYQIARLIFGLVLLVVLILPTTLVIGNLASIMPSGFAVGIGVAALLCGVIFGTRLLAAKFSKR